MSNDNPNILPTVLVQNGVFDTGEPGQFNNPHKITVLFDQPYSETPNIQFGLSDYDANNSSVRVAAKITDPSPTGFVAEIKTWANSSIFYAQYNWIAIGAPRG